MEPDNIDEEIIDMEEDILMDDDNEDKFEFS